MLPHQFKKLLETVRSATEVLRTDLNEIKNEAKQQIESTRDTSQAANIKRGEVGGVIVSAIEAANKDVPAYTKAQHKHENAQRKLDYRIQKRMLCAAWITAIATCGAFVAAGIYACYAKGQLDQMIESTRQATRAATAAESAAQAAIAEAKTASDALFIQNRPWLSLKSISCDTCWTIIGGASRGISVQDDLNHLQGRIAMSTLKAEVVNTGKTPAKDVTIDFTFHFGAVSSIIGNCKMNVSTPCLPAPFDTRNFVGTADFPISTIHQHPVYAGVIAPGEGSPILLGNENRILSVPDASKIPSVYVEGTITYGNTLGAKRGVTKFCFFPILSYGNPDAKKPEQYSYCDNPGTNTMQ